MITPTQILLIILLIQPIPMYIIYHKITKKRNPLLEFYLITCYTLLGISITAAIIFQDLVTLLTQQIITTTAIFFIGTINILMLLALMTMYKKTEDQRINITELTKEIAYIKQKKEKKKVKKKWNK